MIKTKRHSTNLPFSLRTNAGMTVSGTNSTKQISVQTQLLEKIQGTENVVQVEKMLMPNRETRCQL